MSGPADAALKQIVTTCTLISPATDVARLRRDLGPWLEQQAADGTRDVDALVVAGLVRLRTAQHQLA
jgi:hypothetical protein